MKPRAVVSKKSVFNASVFNAQPEGRMAHIRLDYNENLIGPSPKVVQAIQNMIGAEYATYPEYEVLHQKLAHFLDIRPEEVLSTNGSDDAIKLLMETYVEKGEEVILLKPSFEMFRIHAETAEANILEIEYRQENWEFPLEELIAAITPKTRLVVIANPNNPTGTWIHPNLLDHLFASAPHTLFLLDEAYALFAPASALHLFKNHPHVVITQSFSKGYGLAALRMGMIIAQEAIILELKKVQLSSSVNQMAVVATLAAIEDHDHVYRAAQEINRMREAVKKALEGLGYTVYPSQGNFLLVNFGKDYESVKKWLKEAHILVRDKGEDPLMKGCVRIGIGTELHMDYLIKIIEEGKKTC